MHKGYGRMEPEGVSANGLQMVRKGLRIVAGALLIALGLLGLAVPILPGWALILLGVVLAAPRSRGARWMQQQAASLKTRWLRRKRFLS